MIYSHNSVSNGIQGGRYVVSNYNSKTFKYGLAAFCISLTVHLRIILVNTFAASYLNTQGLNNSCLKSSASTLVDLTFQSRALRSFSLNQLRNLSL